MKSIKIILLVFFAAIQNCNQVKKSPKYSCGEFIETIFNESFFYIPNPGQLNLTGIDTITILDRGGYLNSFSCQSEGEFLVDANLLNKGSDYSWSELDSNIIQVERKVYQIKKEDDIPIRIKNFRANLEDQQNPKYRCYFVLEQLRTNGDSIYVHLEKYITNHRIGLTFVRRNDEWHLVDKLIGQY